MIEVREYLNLEAYEGRFEASRKRLEATRSFLEPDRLPVMLSTNYRFSERFHQISMREYFLDPRRQIVGNLLHTRFMLENFDHDVLGTSTMAPSFHNTVEASGMGCEVYFPEHDVAMAKTPLLEDIHDIDSLEVPDPRKDGLMGKCFEYYDFFQEELGNQMEIRAGGSTDGTFTLATQIVNPVQIVKAMRLEPDLVHALMSICLETEISWIEAKLDRDGELRKERESWHFADDACQLLSPTMYEEFVAPYHRKLVDRFSSGQVSGIHMCGQVAHLIPSIWRLFHPKQWDLGYPIDPLWAKEMVGEDCILMGNVSPLLLATGSVADVEAATRECIDSLSAGAGYVVMDGNNIPGNAPVENVRAMVRVAHDYGRYPAG